MPLSRVPVCRVPVGARLEPDRHFALRRLCARLDRFRIERSVRLHADRVTSGKSRTLRTTQTSKPLSGSGSAAAARCGESCHTRSKPMAPAIKRVVAVGASNLTRGFQAVLSNARKEWGLDVEVLAALGDGRADGASSRFVVRRLPGILESDLWNTCSRHRRPPLAPC